MPLLESELVAVGLVPRAMEVYDLLTIVPMCQYHHDHEGVDVEIFIFDIICCFAEAGDQVCFNA